MPLLSLHTTSMLIYSQTLHCKSYTLCVPYQTSKWPLPAQLQYEQIEFSHYTSFDSKVVEVILNQMRILESGTGLQNKRSLSPSDAMKSYMLYFSECSFFCWNPSYLFSKFHDSSIVALIPALVPLISPSYIAWMQHW